MDLKTCPFCGGEAVHDNDNGEPIIRFRHKEDCFLSDMETIYDCPSNIYRWNNRAERTCRMEPPIDGEYRCSECGHLIRDTYRYDSGWHRPMYCTHCGAKVIE